jgi:hypothetical protein
MAIEELGAKNLKFISKQKFFKVNHQEHYIQRSPQPSSELFATLASLKAHVICSHNFLFKKIYSEISEPEILSGFLRFESCLVNTP